MAQGRHRDADGVAVAGARPEVGPVLELRRLSIGALALEEMDLADGICELSQTDLSKVLNAK